jgi:3-deoxy-7-phosphoheptulonate synthase
LLAEAGTFSKPILQVPTYPDAKAGGGRGTSATYPPLVFAGEARNLRAAGRVAKGKAFLLQGGDCAESFAEHGADNIRDFFRAFLQMAIVLTYGSARPVVKVGRIAGQFAKPRSSDIESAMAKSCPPTAATSSTASTSREASRIPDPARQEMAYRQSAATLNLLRAFASGRLCQP